MKKVTEKVMAVNRRSAGKCVVGKNKYAFVEGSEKKYGNRIIRRIVALRSFGDVKKGDVGGWVEGEQNLSQGGRCWIGGDARAIGNSCVKDNAVIKDKVSMIGDSVVAGEAIVEGDVRLMGKARIDGHARVKGRVRVKWMAVVTGTAEIGGDIILTYKDFLDDGKYDRNRVERQRKEAHMVFKEGQKKTGKKGAIARWGGTRGKTKTLPISKDVYDRLISAVGISDATAFSGHALTEWIKEGHALSEAIGFKIVLKDNGLTKRVRVMPKVYDRIKKLFGFKKTNDGAMLVEVVSKAVTEALDNAVGKNKAKTASASVGRKRK